MNQANLPKGLKNLILGSLGVHVLIVIVSVASLGFTTNDKPKNVVVTKLVKLGKKRPDDMLPRLLKENRRHLPKRYPLRKSPSPKQNQLKK